MSMVKPKICDKFAATSKYRADGCCHVLHGSEHATITKRGNGEIQANFSSVFVHAETFSPTVRRSNLCKTSIFATLIELL